MPCWMHEPTPSIEQESGEHEEHIQSTSKYFGAKGQIAAATFKHMLTHLVQFVQQNEQKGI